MRALDAELVVHGGDFDDAKAYAVQLVASDEHAHFVPSYHRDLVAGVATYARELFVAGTFDVVYVPIGLGSGISGVLAVRDLLRLDTEVVGVVAERFPAYQRSYRAAPDPLALVRAELVAVEEILAANEVMMAEVGDPEIGIEARCDVALARQPESLRDVGRRDGGDARLVQPALGQQQLARRLAARHATPHMKEVLPALQLEGAGRVVGDDHRQSSLGKHVPEAVAVVRGPERRRAFAHAAKALEVVLHI